MKYWLNWKAHLMAVGLVCLSVLAGVAVLATMGAVIYTLKSIPTGGIAAIVGLGAYSLAYAAAKDTCGD